MRIGKMWVVEYSVKQRYFHVEQLEDYVANNICNITQDISTDYQIIGFCETREETRTFIQQFQAQQRLPIKKQLQL